MSPDFELTPPTDLRITRRDSDAIELRTGIGSWWLGGLGLIALCGVFLSGVGTLGYALWHLDFRRAIGAIVSTVLASAFLALFAGALLHERLLITRTGLTWTLRLFSLTVRRKSADYGDITSLEVVDVGDSEGSSYKLEFMAGKVSARFSGGSDRANLERLQNVIARQRKG